MVVDDALRRCQMQGRVRKDTGRYSAMAMVVKNNQSATRSLNQLNVNNKNLEKSLKKVSTGMKITSAEDDSSGYAISERMRVQIRGLDQANSNTETGSSMLKIAEDAVANSLDLLKTLKEKAINAANDTNTDEDRRIIQKELDQTIAQIDDNAMVTYNGQYLLDGTKNSVVFEPGTKTSLTNHGLAETTTGDTKLVDLMDVNWNKLEIRSTDSLTVSYVKQGETHIITVSPVGDNTIRSVFQGNTDEGTPVQNDIVLFEEKELGVDPLTGDTTYDYSCVGQDEVGEWVYTPDNGNSLTFRASEAGVAGQIAGLTFCFTDQHGNLKGTANAVMDNFTETVRAQDPSDDNSIVVHAGTRANQSVKVGITDMGSEALGLTWDGYTIDVSNQANANAAINVFENAIQKALDQATALGSALSRLSYTSSNLVTSSENAQGSESTIRDADMAKEMTAYTKNNVLQQAAQSMLAQANQNSSAVLSLLQ